MQQPPGTAKPILKEPHIMHVEAKKELSASLARPYSQVCRLVCEVVSVARHSLLATTSMVLVELRSPCSLQLSCEHKWRKFSRAVAALVTHRVSDRRRWPVPCCRLLTLSKGGGHTELWIQLRL